MSGKFVCEKCGKEVQNLENHLRFFCSKRNEQENEAATEPAKELRGIEEPKKVYTPKTRRVGLDKEKRKLWMKEYMRKYRTEKKSTSSK